MTTKNSNSIVSGLVYDGSRYADDAVLKDAVKWVDTFVLRYIVLSSFKLNCLSPHAAKLVI